MGKGARNRKIRREALALKQEHPSFRGDMKTIVRRRRKKNAN